MASASEPVTIFHNPKCGSSNNALKIADELGIEHDTVLYLKTPPDEPALRAIIAKLEDPVTDLVRRDATWERLGLTDAARAVALGVIDGLRSCDSPHEGDQVLYYAGEDLAEGAAA